MKNAMGEIVWRHPKDHGQDEGCGKRICVNARYNAAAPVNALVYLFFVFTTQSA
jgi:hypothetical protein